MKNSLNQKQLVGVVVSDRMKGTIVVRVGRLVRHPTYQRVIRRSKKFKVDDPTSQAHEGDEVRIVQTRPISKEKCWRLVEVIRRGTRIEDREAQRIAELEAVGVIRPKPVQAPPPSPEKSA